MLGSQVTELIEWEWNCKLQSTGISRRSLLEADDMGVSIFVRN
jgi:hypothetical protein